MNLAVFVYISASSLFPAPSLGVNWANQARNRRAEVNRKKPGIKYSVDLRRNNGAPLLSWLDLPVSDVIVPLHALGHDYHDHGD